jgi:GNAT superfamily N-acetyltransferase
VKRLRFESLTPERWDDFVDLFGSNGACGGCWCMTNRLPRAQYEKQKGAANKRAMKRLVDSGRVPGILAFDGEECVGWCSIEPMESFPPLLRSRIAQPLDEQPAWRVSCLFVRKDARSKGVSVALLKAAVAHARRNGARIVEGFPVEPKSVSKPVPPPFAWTGLARAFERAGFREVARRSPTRPYMRHARR